MVAEAQVQQVWIHQGEKTGGAACFEIRSLAQSLSVPHSTCLCLRLTSGENITLPPVIFFQN